MLFLHLAIRFRKSSNGISRKGEIMIKGYFYNSVAGDRKYNAMDVNESKMPFYKDGVFAGHLGVTAVSGRMAVRVDGGTKTGFAWINAHTIHNTTPLELDVSQASGTLDRIDRVVLKNDETERRPSIYILEGAFSSNPKPKNLTNTEAIQEKCLAEIYVRAGAVDIKQADITDTRSNTVLCGLVASQFKEFDFSQWQRQFESYFTNMKATYKAEWEAWYADIKNILSGDVAGNLLNEIEKRAQIIECNGLQPGRKANNLYMDRSKSAPTSSEEVQMQNSEGKTYFPRTKTTQVYFGDNKTLQEKVGELKGVLKTKNAVEATNIEGYLVDAKALKEIFESIPKIKCGNAVLTHASSAIMRGTVQVGQEWNGCVISLTAKMINGTPYGGSNLWNVVGTVNNGILTIEANGAGFVSGHVLGVDYILMR